MAELREQLETARGEREELERSRQRIVPDGPPGAAESPPAPILTVRVWEINEHYLELVHRDSDRQLLP